MVGAKVSGIERALSGVAGHAAGVGAGDEYVPKCVLVTGGAGFIASHVTIRLVQSYADCKVCPEGAHGLNEVAGVANQANTVLAVAMSAEQPEETLNCRSLFLTSWTTVLPHAIFHRFRIARTSR